MIYYFSIENDIFRIENYWFGETSLVILVNDSKILSISKNASQKTESERYSITHDNDTLHIVVTPKWFSVDVRVFNNKKQEIPAIQSKQSKRKMLSNLEIALDLPNRSFWQRMLFYIEVMTFCFSILLVLSGDFFPGGVLLLLTAIGLIKVNLGKGREINDR